MQVIFIHHSCFLVEVDDKVLIFDYFAGDRLDGFQFKGKLPDYERDTKVYVFASSPRMDHFDPEILTWFKKYPNIHYIIAKDCRYNKAAKANGIDPAVKYFTTEVDFWKNYEVDDLNIYTLKSSEPGVGFYITTNGVSLFYAGDLNDWYWEGAGDLINGKVTRNFRHEVNRLKEKPINLAFVAMDPNLKQHMFRAVDYVLKETDAEYIFPMHMYQDFSGIPAYKKRLSNKGFAERIIDISRENQVFPFGD